MRWTKGIIIFCTLLDDTAAYSPLVVFPHVHIARSRIESSIAASTDDETENIPPPLKSSELMKAMGTSPRRIFVSLSTSIGIAITANFLGITSNILASIPAEVVESSGLDTFYPVGDFKRYNGLRYTLTIPKEWVADTAVELAKAQKKAGTLDYEMKRSRNTAGVIPDAAFGPPGKKDARGLTPLGADTNISIVISNIGSDLTLATIGLEAAANFLRVSLAPKGSGRTVTLLSASEQFRGGRSLYEFEYDVDRGESGVPLRAISVIGIQDGGLLVTSTVVAPRTDWDNETYSAKLRKTIESFKLK